MNRKFLNAAIVMVLFCLAVFFLIWGNGTDWRCFVSLILSIATGVVGAKTNFGTV